MSLSFHQPRCLSLAGGHDVAYLFNGIQDCNRSGKKKIQPRVTICLLGTLTKETRHRKLLPYDLFFQKQGKGTYGVFPWGWFTEVPAGGLRAPPHAVF